MNLSWKRDKREEKERRKRPEREEKERKSEGRRAEVSRSEDGDIDGHGRGYRRIRAGIYRPCGRQETIQEAIQHKSAYTAIGHTRPQVFPYGEPPAAKHSSTPYGVGSACGMTLLYKVWGIVATWRFLGQH